MLGINEPLTVMRDVVAGQFAVRAKGEIYLPRPLDYDDEQWNRYLARAALYNVTAHTITGLTGLVARKNPVFNLPASLASMEEVISTDGDSGPELVRKMVAEILTAGRVIALLEFGNPPLISLFSPESAASRERRVDNRRTLVSLELNDDHSFWDYSYSYGGRGTSEEGVTRTLALDNGRYVSRTSGTTRDATTARGRRLDYIPALSVSAEGIGGFQPVKPPLLDMAYVNLSHYRKSAYYETAMEKHASPIPHASGLSNTKTDLEFGPGRLLKLPEGATMGYLETNANGLEAMRQSMLDDEHRMRSLGAELLLGQRVEVETATAARIRATSASSVLASVVDSVDSALNTLIGWAAEWTGAEPMKNDAGETVPWVAVNRDFFASTLGPQEIQAVMALYVGNAISFDTLYHILNEGELTRPGATAENERELIDAQEPNIPEDEDDPEDDPDN